jgi:hypothetical protein
MLNGDDLTILHDDCTEVPWRILQIPYPDRFSQKILVTHWF